MSTTGTRAGVSIDVTGVSKTFADGTRALKPTSLAIAKGETVVFLGPSGCGKTTFLRIVAGLEKPDAGGRVLFDGEDVTDIVIEKRNIGMVFQSYALFPNMTVSENIAYGLKLRQVAARDKAARVREMLALCGIEALADRRIDQLSGGQRQRVALARAVAIRPRVLLLDEPLTALDAALRERLRTELDQLLRTLGITAIYVTHDQAEAMALGDRIVVMQSGEIVQAGTPRDIYFKPQTRFVAEFIGAANVLRGHVREGRLAVAGGTIAVEAPQGEAEIVIRPEALRITDAATSAWRGRITGISFLGDRQRLVIADATEHALTAEAPSSQRFALGETVGLETPSNAIHVLGGSHQ
jgi:putative spermidine/putrescine transport system ATP-binding protein